MYAVIDIETSGGKYDEEGITEIAIYKYDGHQIVDQLIALVNPQRPMQPFVIRLTGIHPKMLRSAPKFHEIAKRIVKITENCVLIAHNASFDYRILRTEFDRLGYDFVRKTICTVELSKKILPDMPSYSLGKLCKSVGIPMSNRHRASGDALATLKLFQLLLSKDSSKEIIKKTVKSLTEKTRPNLSKNLTGILDEIPSKTGLFYIHNTQGEIVYMGRSKNLKKSVRQLYLKTSKKADKLREITHSISHELTGSELISEMKFHTACKLNKPKFNNPRLKKLPEVVFKHENMLLVDKGRTPHEKSIVSIENNQLTGIGFVDLAHQINDPKVLQNLLTQIDDSTINRHAVKKHLERGKIERIIRF